MIKTLPQEVITHIAAGQVVEKAASVVKELIENSLDAGAHCISIELENAGYDRISVTDDGYGMSQRDLEKSFLPHTTSKIHTVEDLLGIRSFGFRGEALASIAAVSSITIESKQKKGIKGWKVEVDTGTLVASTPVGMPDGTRVTVERLFADIPARKKFVRTGATELREIMDMVTRCALAHPDVSFEVQHNHADILRTHQRQNILDMLAQLVDARFAQSALPVDYVGDNIRISGYISAPAVSRGSDTSTYISLHGRPIHNPDLRKVIKKAYGSLLEPRAYPITVLRIEYPHESFDINVDPHKELVRFFQQDAVHEHLTLAIKQGLQAHTAGYTIRTSDPVKEMDMELGRYLKEKVIPWNPKDIPDGEIAQLFRVYLVIERDKEMLLVDQHAAHERILYEEYMAAYKAEKHAAEPHVLPKPYLLNVSAIQAGLLEEYADELTRLGFQISEFGTYQYKVEAVPEYLKKRHLDELIPDMLDELAYGTEMSADNKSHRTLTYLACRSAIMAGDPLTQDERKKLIIKLFQCEDPYTCPHGRPTCIRMTRQELDIMFKRR